MTALGIALIVQLDLIVPIAIAAGLIVINVRHHRSRRTEGAFWIWTATALVLPIVFGVIAVVQVFDYEGRFIVPVAVTSIPGSLVPVIATVGLSQWFFDDESWAASAYFVVMPVFAVGAILWQFFVIVAIRRIVQNDRARARTAR